MIDVVVAAFDTPEEVKSQAMFVCDEKDARPVLQQAIDKADALGVNCVLLRGNYVINSRSERSRKGAVCFYNPEPATRFYAQNKARRHVLMGCKLPLGYRDGAVIRMGQELYDSIQENELFSMFYNDGNDIFGRGMVIKNLIVRLPDNQKPIVVFNGQFAGDVRFEDNWVIAFDPLAVNWASAEGINVPNPKSAAYRGCCGSNFYATEWKNCVAAGFGIGFDIGGEHVYCESLSALYNGYGFAFNNYKGKKSIEDPDDVPSLGVGIYPMVCVNLLDEHNINMPLFGTANHNGYTPECRSQSITVTGMNIQWPNTCPGHTDRTAPDFTDGRKRATETNPGFWRGSIEYVIDHTTPTHGVALTDEPFFEDGSGQNIELKNLHSMR